MRILVASDSEMISAKIRELLVQRGYECPAGHTVTVASSVNYVTQIKPDVVLLVFPPRPDSAMAALDELSGTTRAPVLAVGPSKDADLILQALRAGAAHYLDDDALEFELGPALTKLATKSAVLVDPGRVITVMSPSGGSGSSTIAANIAVSLARQHGRCALFDMKLEGGDQTTLLDLEPAHSLADFCNNIARVDQNLFTQCFAQHSSGVYLLAPPQNYGDVRMVTPRGVRKAFSMARAQFPYVVVDLDHSFRDEYTQALYQSDVLLLIVRLDIVSLRQTHRCLEYIRELGVAEDRIRLVVNRYRWRKELRRSQMERTLGMRIRHFVPDDPVNLKRSNHRGKPIVLHRPSTKVARSLEEIATAVNGQHKHTE